ncbi:MAG: ATP-binding cassette domain-containing protein [Hespellia sp.]|nr:ATP-binding cassette domain-containing protein [Hespellia sp.]
MVEISHLQKSYGAFSLNNISFLIQREKITGFIGNNGAGKTTTIKCILGLLSYEAGKISINGKTMYQNERSYKEKIGVVFDEGYFYNKLNMVSMKNIIAGAYANWDEKKYKEYIQKFGLSETQRIDTMSKGMKMKFSLALALSHNAELLILDEPSGGLDPRTRQLFCSELLAQKNEGKTIFFSTHITSDLDKIGDNIILIDNGSILRETSKDEFIKESKLNTPTIEDAMTEIINRGELDAYI